MKTETEYTNQIVCPHCYHEDSDSWETSESGMTSCGSCSKDFYVEVEHSVEYTSTCGENKSDCDFVDNPSEKHPDYQECSRCSQTNFKRFN